jgi:hypothetical protein
MILSPDSLLQPATYLHMERFVNDGSPSGFTQQHNTSWETSATGDCSSFQLAGMNFHSSIKQITLGKFPDHIASWDMFIHPDMIDLDLLATFKDRNVNALEVVPTSSGRTVFVCGPVGGFLKLNYYGMLGRIDRQMTMNHARSAIEVSAFIADTIESGALPEALFLMREVAARVAFLKDGDSTYEWGMLYREPLVFPHTDQVCCLIPAFSLFSKDQKRHEDPSILSQLIAAQKQSPDEFVFERLLRPLLNSYFGLLTKCCLQIEAHAQNILFAVDARLQVLGIVVRDAESIDKDFSLAERLGLTLPLSDMSYKVLRSDQYNYQIMHSFMFDFKMGEYLIAPIIEQVVASHGIDERTLTNCVREHVAKLTSSLPEDFFPDDGCWYSYKNVIHKQGESRSYIAQPNPKFR